MGSSLDARLLATASPAALAYVATRGRWTPFAHLLEVDRALLDVAAGRCKRLIVQLPIRHGKSVLVSQYTPAWWLGRHPDSQVMLAAYEATFARSWGRKSRDVLAEHGPSVFGVSVAETPAAADWWQVQDHEGVMVTAGVGGALTGKGADLLIIDDPVKNAEEAGSQVFRDKAWDWLGSTALSRLQPGGAVVLVMARWHEDDLAGRLQAQHPVEWTVFDLPAVVLPDDPMGSRPGEALCPELFDAQALQRARRELGAYWFSALMQQRPSPPAGLLFRREHFRYWTEVQSGTARYWVLDGERRVDQGHCTIFQTVDVAASTRQTADYTVVSTWARTPDSDLLALDVKRRRFELMDVAGFIRLCNEEWLRCPLFVERFGHGLGVFDQLKRDGYPIRELRPETDKVSRALTAVARYEQHAVFHPRGAEWLDAFEAELLGFPNGQHDDQADTVAYAARLLPMLAPPQRAPQQTGRPVLSGVMGRRF